MTGRSADDLRQPPVGVLVMAHGTPASRHEVEPFYTSIRRGRPPTPALLADLVARYDALGGVSPLAERTRAQVEGVADALEAKVPGGFLVGYGAKHTSPDIEDGVASLAEAGVRHLVGVVLTPHQSTAGSGEYLRRAAVAAAKAELGFTGIPSWHRAPGLAVVMAERLGGVLAGLGPEERRRPTVFFTAHSLPERFRGEGDPYFSQVGESASDVAEILGLGSVAADGTASLPGVTWHVAWQSAGRTDEPWVGPDLLTEIRRVAEQGATTVVVCPVGFVADHLEVLYDVDIEAAEVARSSGITLARTPSLNDDPRFMALLADVVRSALAPRQVGKP